MSKIVDVFLGVVAAGVFGLAIYAVVLMWAWSVFTFGD
jgi:hypothetical protein